jgi:monoamine oxidase
MNRSPFALPASDKPHKKILILGAGMAGLTAGYELKRAGHDVAILEARHRIGGRVHTLREPFAPGLYAEVGAMRIPKVHRRTLSYIEYFGLPTRPFTIGNPQTYFYVEGARIRRAEYAANPDLLRFDLAPHERGRAAADLWSDAIKDLVALVERDGDEGWQALEEQYGELSLEEFLIAKGFSEGACEAFGLLENAESQMNNAFIEWLSEDVRGFYRNLCEIEGGMDRLPASFYPELQKCIQFGAEVVAFDQTPEKVIAHYQTATGKFSAEADYAICTIPFPVLRHIEFLKPLSAPKQKAIRELYYDASAKILFQCRRRFWEDDEGIVGGGTETDLPIRAMYYPDHGRETGRGVILASYTWGQDAERWGSLPPEKRIRQALEDAACIHPQIVEEFEVGASHFWHSDEYAGGAFALFAPGQLKRLHAHIIAPEGRIHFAGEHASHEHAWIDGAIESGLRAAGAIHQLP